MNIIQGGQGGIAAQFADAGIELEKPTTEKQPEVKQDQAKQTISTVPDDAEDENGLTAADRAELTKKHQRAIGRKHAALKEAEAMAQTEYNGRRHAEERAEALQRELDELKSKSAQAKAEPPQRPKREDFESDEAYRRADVRWEVQQEMAEERRKEAEKAEQARQAEAVKAAHARIAHAREVVDDFDEVIGAADMNVPPHVAGYMQESEMFAELGYHFAKHPDDLERVAKLSIPRALVEIGKIESKLTPFHSSKDGKLNGSQPSQSKENGTQKTETSEAKPNTTAIAPNKRPAPVITPLPVGTGTTDSVPRSQKEHGVEFGKRNGVDIYQRKRH